MVQQIINMLATAFDAVSNWMIRIFDASGTVGIYLGAMVILFSVRYLLAPLFGSKVGSDTAKAKKGDDD